MAIEEVLLIGGPAGVGKTSVGWEVSVQLNRAAVAHWHLEGDVRMRGVLLTAAESTRFERLTARETGSDLDRHLVSTRTLAERLERDASAWVARISTDVRTVSQVAAKAIEVSGWES